jgi:hypothetical protein
LSTGKKGDLSTGFQAISVTGSFPGTGRDKTRETAPIARSLSDAETEVVASTATNAWSAGKLSAASTAQVIERKDEGDA